MLELADIKGEEIRSWKKKTNIPMNLIGGRFNHHAEIKVSQLKNASEWFSGFGTEGIDYLAYAIYEPNLIYRWIIDQINRNPEERHPDYLPAGNPRIPGLISDRSSVKVNRYAPVFINRPDTDIFIKHYYLKMKELKKDSLF